jgi:hypothetical protein
MVEICLSQPPFRRKSSFYDNDLALFWECGGKSGSAINKERFFIKKLGFKVKVTSKECGMKNKKNRSKIRFDLQAVLNIK